VGKIVWFVRDYVSRHRNPWNRALHLVGVPLSPFATLVLVVLGEWVAALVTFVVGYALQVLGHRIEGNEVGEWILVKNLTGRLVRRA
jgi:hypothetical protein